MKLRRWQKVLVILLALLGASALVAYLALREPPPDTRFTGAYLLADGRRVYVTPREGEVLRYRLEDGESGALYPEGELRYVSGPGWSGREPVELEVTFRMDAAGRPEGFAWQRVGRPVGDRAGGALEARRLDLPEEVFTFPSDDLALRGKLVLPTAPGPHPAAVLVHGSESFSAVDHYFLPYLFAAHGIATLAYDKRGTGESEGEYTQNFHVLGRMLDEAEGETWFQAVAGSDSTLGFLADTWMPRWLIKLYAKWKIDQTVDGEPLADRLYDPVPVVASLDVPSLWIFGGEDSSMPTAWSVAELERLQAAGRPIEILVFPEAEHGILRFEEGEDGERRYLGYEPEYLMTMVRWLRERSGLEPVPSP